MMVGLRVVLEESSSSCTNRRNSSALHHQVVSKASLIITKTSPTSPAPPSPNPYSSRSHPSSNTSFLENCFLCRKKLLPTYDIYMYKGDIPFCSEECRSREMYMDEEETAAMKAKTKRGDNCSLSAIKPQRHHASSSPSRSSPSSRKGTAKISNNVFVY